jgi:hypothetical protein
LIPANGTNGVPLHFKEIDYNDQITETPELEHVMQPKS